MSTVFLARCIRCRTRTQFKNIRTGQASFKRKASPDPVRFGVCCSCDVQQFLLHEVGEIEKGKPRLQIVSNITIQVPENREEWLAWRMKGIGGSDAPAIMKASPWVTPLELWARKTNRMAPQSMTYPMLRGIRLEPEARRLYEEIKRLEMPKKCLQRTDYSFARGSYDGLNIASVGDKIVRHGFEGKAPGKADHELALRGEVPEKYFWQCMHLYWTGELESLDYVSYHPDYPPGKRIAIIPVPRDLEAEEILIKAETTFWEYVVNDIPPPEPKRMSSGSNIFPIRRTRHG